MILIVSALYFLGAIVTKLRPQTSGKLNWVYVRLHGWLSGRRVYQRHPWMVRVLLTLSLIHILFVCLMLWISSLIQRMNQRADPQHQTDKQQRHDEHIPVSYTHLTERLYAAQAKGIEMIKNSDPSLEFLTLKGYEALQKMADGKATKLIIPSNLQDITGTLASLAEVVKPIENKE